jgi:hypothetical protein
VQDTRADCADCVRIRRRASRSPPLALPPLRSPVDECRGGAGMRETSMSHRFRAGEQVRFTRGYPYRDADAGPYEIVRQLPHGEGDYQYRIKSAREQHERVVKEGELERA